VSACKEHRPRTRAGRCHQWPGRLSIQYRHGVCLLPCLVAKAV